MRKKLNIVLSILMIFIFFTQTVSAATLTITGTADHEALGITVLVLNKGTKISGANKDNVVYVNQTNISPDGKFSFTLPLIDSDEYEFYSNMNFDVVEDSGEMLDVVYVSSKGNDYGNGSSEFPFATLSRAYSRMAENGKIIIKDSADYVPSSKKAIIEGETNAVTLALGSEVILQNDLTLSNITLSGSATIYAEGYSLTAENTVSTTDRLNVYGGSRLKDISGDTNITLLGGKYNNIFGGGYTKKVTGNTNVVLGGTANKGEGIDDGDEDTLSPCMVYGGGNNGAVLGKTNVTLQDDAVAKYLVGSGYNENGAAADTNIYIKGGKVMNVYAGSRNTVLPNGTTTHVTITGGMAESIFGGCESVALTGHTFVNLIGGQVTRRVYSGCYNGTGGIFNITWNDSRHVKGTTNISIGPNVKLNTEEGLSSGNRANVGVFAGSRMESQFDEEQNTIIYLDGCYSSHNQYIGDEYSSSFKSFEDYIVKSAGNGSVVATTTPGTVYVAPDRGYLASVGGGEYENENVIISAGTTGVNFIEKDFFISSLTAGEITATGLNGFVDIFANNRANREEPKIYIAIYDKDQLVSVCFQSVTKSNDNLTFDLKCKLEKGKTYTVKAMIWDKNIEPLATAYEIMVR